MRLANGDFNAQFSAMSPAEKQLDLVERYNLIPDPQERLMAVSGHRCEVGLPDEKDKVDSNLVPGCQSRVWLIASCEGGKLTISLDSDSSLVKGLARLIADVYQGVAPAAAAAYETDLLQQLNILATLSPTRQNGLANVIAAIRRQAASLC